MEHRALTARELTLGALFVAVLCALSQIAIPLPMGVPISLGLLGVYLCALLLPPKMSLAVIAVYLLLGLVGVPVYAGFKAGPAALFGRTGGYLVGYLPCGLIIALMNRRGRNFLWRCLSVALGLAACYLLGTLWFMHLTGFTAGKALAACVLPFLPGDAVKMLAAAGMAPQLKAALQKAFALRQAAAAK